MTTGSSPIAPTIAARWEIDLSGGGVSSPRRRSAGSKRMGSEILHERQRALVVPLRYPQRDLAAREVRGRGQAHVGDVDALAAQGQCQFSDDARPVGHREAQLAARAGVQGGLDE